MDISGELEAEQDQRDRGKSAGEGVDKGEDRADLERGGS